MDFKNEKATTEIKIIPPEKQVMVSVKLRMVVLGASRTGKTQLMSRFLGENFSDTYMPTVEEYHRKIYTIRGRTYQLDVLETAGMSSNSINQNVTLMTGDFYLIVYSITNKASYETAKELAFMVEESVQKVASETKHSGLRHWNCKKQTPATVPVVLAGNKSDLDSERQVSHDEVYDWLMESRARFSKTRVAHIEVSAKDLSSVQRLFEMVFSSAQLPVEMSPSMHRKVSTNTFIKNTSKLNQVRHREHHSPKFFNRWVSSYDFGSDHSSTTDSLNNDIIEEQDECDDAFAVTCSYQRRPSTASEVSSVMNKAKNAHGHYIPKGVFMPFQKLKKSLARATSSHI